MGNVKGEIADRRAGSGAGGGDGRAGAGRGHAVEKGRVQQGLRVGLERLQVGLDGGIGGILRGDGGLLVLPLDFRRAFRIAQFLHNAGPVHAGSQAADRQAGGRAADIAGGAADAGYCAGRHNIIYIGCFYVSPDSFLPVSSNTKLGRRLAPSEWFNCRSRTSSLIAGA